MALQEMRGAALPRGRGGEPRAQEVRPVPVQGRPAAPTATGINTPLRCK